MTDYVTRDQITPEWVSFRLSGCDPTAYIHDGDIDNYAYRIDLGSIRGRCCLTRSLLWVEDHREATLLRLRGYLPQPSGISPELELVQVEWSRDAMAARLKKWGEHRSLSHFRVTRYRDFLQIEFARSGDVEQDCVSLNSISRDAGWWLRFRTGKIKGGASILVHRMYHELASRYAGWVRHGLQ